MRIWTVTLSYLKGIELAHGFAMGYTNIPTSKYVCWCVYA